MNYGEDFKKYAMSHGISGMNLHYFENSVTPYILEERKMNVAQMDIFSRLMINRQLFVFGVVEEHMSNILQAQLLYLDDVNKKDIFMNLNTPGGSVIHGNGIVDVMDYIDSDVCTNNIGICASMGSVLLSSGTKGKRTSLISSRVMIHQASSGASGHVADNRISHRQTEEHNYLLLKRIARNCGKTIDELLAIAPRDKWFHSDQALEYGIIDSIIDTKSNGNRIPVPTMTEQMEGFDEYYMKVLAIGKESGQ